MLTNAFRLAIAFLLAGVASISSAAVMTFFSELSGAAEAPPNASPGTGTVFVVIDDDADTMQIIVDFANLSSPSTVAHIHCCTTDPATATAAVATTTPTFPGFPVGVIAGGYNQTFDMTQAASFRAGFITANGGTTQSAFNALVLGLQEERAYFNLHTQQFPAGEIRGFLQLPTPASSILFALGLSLLGFGLKRRSK